MFYGMVCMVRTKITLSNRYIQTFYCTDKKTPHFTNIFLIKNKTDIPTFPHKHIIHGATKKPFFGIIMGYETYSSFQIELISLWLSLHDLFC